MPRSALEYFSASQPPKALKNLTNDLWNIIESNFQTVSLIGCNLTFCYERNIKKFEGKTLPPQSRRRTEAKWGRCRRNLNHPPLKVSFNSFFWKVAGRHWSERSVFSLLSASLRQNLLGIPQAALKSAKTLYKYHFIREWFRSEIKAVIHHFILLLILQQQSKGSLANAQAKSFESFMAPALMRWTNDPS